MRVITKEEFLLHKTKYLQELRNAVFIYPTDTIYGIGCDATNEHLVQRIRKLKGSTHPFSVIAPSVQWVVNHCLGSLESELWLQKLPGPYTFIFNLKIPESVAHSVTNTESIGVRMPHHWFTQIVNELGFPVLTTSANKVGQDFMTSLDDLDPVIKMGVDLIIYEGEKIASPSTLIHLNKADVEIQER